jgi:hypothetical protein
MPGLSPARDRREDLSVTRKRPKFFDEAKVNRGRFGMSIHG